MFLPSDLFLEYMIESIATELPGISLTFLNMIFSRGVSGFVKGCLCDVWGHKLSTSSLFVGLLFFGNLILHKLVC